MNPGAGSGKHAGNGHAEKDSNPDAQEAFQGNLPYKVQGHKGDMAGQKIHGICHQPAGNGQFSNAAEQRRPGIVFHRLNHRVLLL